MEAIIKCKFGIIDHYLIEDEQVMSYNKHSALYGHSSAHVDMYRF